MDSFSANTLQTSVEVHCMLDTQPKIIINQMSSFRYKNRISPRNISLFRKSKVCIIFSHLVIGEFNSLC